MIHQLINDERFINIQRAQAGLSRIFQEAAKNLSFYRVMRNDQPLGVLIPDDLWQSLTEDIEALSSPNFRRRIAQARKDKNRLTAKQVRKVVGLK